MIRRAVLVVSMLGLASWFMAIASGVRPAIAQVQNEFDPSKPVTVEGTLSGFVVDTGATFLLIDGSGQKESWALLGDDLNALLAAGWRIKQLPLGRQVKATGYGLRPGANAMPFMPPEPSAALSAAIKSGRLVHGIDVTFPDGTTLRFGAAK